MTSSEGTGTPGGGGPFARPRRPRRIAWREDGRDGGRSPAIGPSGTGDRGTTAAGAAALALCLAALACGDGRRDAGGKSLREIVPDGTVAAWSGLLHPVVVDAGPDGRVYVGDQGDMTVKVFGPRGRRLGTVGGQGRGPGELARVGEVEVSAGEIGVLDARRRAVVRFDTAGGEIGRLDLTGLEEAFSYVGGDLALASSPAWSLPPPGGERASWPLVRVTDTSGRALWEAGERSRPESAFAAHIRNFVLPAGTPDGEGLWLAHLNGTAVSHFTGPGRTPLTIHRDLPFEWRRIPADFTPSPELLAGEGGAGLPFDAVTLDIDTDGAGNAFLLTALGPTGADPGLEDVPVAVDRVEAGSLRWTRNRAPAPATDLAVSPDGRRIYLLHEPTARLRVYARGR